jgi:hypothetical protein
MSKLTQSTSIEVLVSSSENYRNSAADADPRFIAGDERTTKLAGERFKAKYLCFQQLFKAVYAATTAKGPARKIMTHQTELAATMMASFHDSSPSRTALSQEAHHQITSQIMQQIKVTTPNVDTIAR